MTANTFKDAKTKESELLTHFTKQVEKIKKMEWDLVENDRSAKKINAANKEMVFLIHVCRHRKEGGGSGQR